MNLDGEDFLDGACEPALLWCRRYDTLADAWDACDRTAWLWWAIERMRRRGYDIPWISSGCSADGIKNMLGNPFRVAEMCCDFCIMPRVLSEREQEDSRLFGTLRRCPEHIAALAPQWSVAA